MRAILVFSGYVFMPDWFRRLALNGGLYKISVSDGSLRLLPFVDSVCIRTPLCGLCVCGIGLLMHSPNV